MDELITTTCYRCGAQGATKYLESLNAWVHHDTRRCVSALRARAEAAEKRVTELESQLAARWRPVTEPPPGSEPSDGSSLWLVCWDYDPEAGCRLARYAPFIRMWFMEGDEGQPIDPTHYRVNDLPAPPPPQPPPTELTTPTPNEF